MKSIQREVRSWKTARHEAPGVRFSITLFPFSQTSEPPPVSLNPRKRRCSSRSNGKLLYLLCLVYSQRFWNVPPPVGEWAFFQPACQVPGCLLCASVCVIRDRDWIRDGSVLTVRWKYHTHYLYLPTRPLRSGQTGAPVPPLPKRTNISFIG